MTKDKLLNKIALLDPSDDDTKKRIVCAIIGHSKIQSMYFGYVSCGRCGEQIGDTLGGVYDTTDSVIIGHNCQTCRDNYRKLGWEDKWMVPDPFVENESMTDEDYAR